MNLKYFAMTALAVSLLAGCQSNEPEETAAPEPARSTPAAEQPAPARRSAAEQRPARTEPAQASTTDVNPAREIPRLEGELGSEGYGMTMIVDGSSPEAFAESRKIIASDTSPEQYQALDSAIRYMKTYSMGSRDLETFYQSLDGMTAEEIIERAHSRNRQ